MILKDFFLISNYVSMENLMTIIYSESFFKTDFDCDFKNVWAQMCARKKGETILLLVNFKEKHR